MSLPLKIYFVMHKYGLSDNLLSLESGVAKMLALYVSPKLQCHSLGDIQISLPLNIHFVMHKYGLSENILSILTALSWCDCAQAVRSLYQVTWESNNVP